MPRVKYIIAISLIFLASNLTMVQAEDNVSLDIKVLKIDQATAKKGYTAMPFGNKFILTLSPEALTKETEIVFKDFYDPGQVGEISQNLKIVGHLYEFDIVDKSAYDQTKPLIIEFNYPSDSNNYKKIYYWNGIDQKWTILPNQTMTHYGRIRLNIHLPYMRLGVFEDNLVMSEGIASWYKYKNCDCAASPDYSKGSKLRVTNLDNNKSVVVTINDYGPDRTVHPDRVIDLDLLAFRKIAGKAEGLINIKIEPINEMAVSIASASENSTSTEVELIAKENYSSPEIGEISAKSAIVVNAKTREIIWAKNEKEILPIASLTKLMTAEVFLQHNPGWESPITYKDSDEDVFQYASKWQSSSLQVGVGEKMTVKDLYYSSLVGSANNATYALARSTGLLRRDFVNAMNYQADLWGMKNTHFTEPSGLDPKNVSTAYDLAKLSFKIFKEMDFLKGTTSKKYSFSTINTNKPHLIKNTNQLLKSDLYILGTKTGYLDEAGHCLVSKVVKDAANPDKELIIVVLGAKSKADSAAETVELANWALKQI